MASYKYQKRHQEKYLNQYGNGDSMWHLCHNVISSLSRVNISEISHLRREILWQCKLFIYCVANVS